jgi:hypothetical protein
VIRRRAIAEEDEEELRLTICVAKQQLDRGVQGGKIVAV